MFHFKFLFCLIALVVFIVNQSYCGHHHEHSHQHFKLDKHKYHYKYKWNVNHWGKAKVEKKEVTII